jgi:hypothetical protein
MTTLAAALAGCGSDGAAGTVDPTINYGSYGGTADIDCANGKSLNVAGSNNTLTVSGSCASVRVGGADNTIKLARIDGELSVAGFNNTITYKAGDPNVDDAGSGNRISREISREQT